MIYLDFYVDEIMFILDFVDRLGYHIKLINKYLIYM